MSHANLNYKVCGTQFTVYSTKSNAKKARLMSVVLVILATRIVYFLEQLDAWMTQNYAPRAQTLALS